MKKTFKETTIGRLLIGFADGFTGGAVSNIVYADITAPENKPDYSRLIGSATILLLIYAYVNNKLTWDQLNTLLNYFN